MKKLEDTKPRHQEHAPVTFKSRFDRHPQNNLPGTIISVIERPDGFKHETYFGTGIPNVWAYYDELTERR